MWAAGTAGGATILFVTWSVSRLRHERRRRDEWSTTLLASPADLAPDAEGGV
jgi:hypothetical protein